MKEFLDEFKHLEKICCEIYGQQHGVTQYIDDMEDTPSFIASSIPDFYEDLRDLKRVRHIRNNMVHESGYDEDYTQEDVLFMKAFFERIMNRRDPLAERQKLLEERAAKAPQKTKQVVRNVPTVDISNSQRSKGGYTFAFKVIIGIVLLAIAFGGVACVWGLISLFF